MKYFEAQTLNEHIIESGCLSESEAKKCFRVLIDAINLLHNNKIAHRDIKPQNILINKDLELKLIDFNISKKGKMITNNASETDHKLKHKFKYRFLTQVSTPLYAAPEIANHTLYTESVDIYLLGLRIVNVKFLHCLIKTQKPT